MEDTKTKVNVIFKVCKGELTAFILDKHSHIIDANHGNILCYAHIGQHSEADYGYYLRGKQATPSEYKELKAELESIGYDIKVVKKIQYS